jgi:hypothetical protein
MRDCVEYMTRSAKKKRIPDLWDNDDSNAEFEYFDGLIDYESYVSLVSPRVDEETNIWLVYYQSLKERAANKAIMLGESMRLFEINTANPKQPSQKRPMFKPATKRQLCNLTQYAKMKMNKGV